MVATLELYIKKRKESIEKEKEKYHYILVIWWNNTILKKKGLVVKYETFREITNRVSSWIPIIIKSLILLQLKDLSVG